MRNTLSGAPFARIMVAGTLQLLPLASHAACVSKVSTNDVAGVGATRCLMSRSRRSIVEVSAKKYVGVAVVTAPRPLAVESSFDRRAGAKLAAEQGACHICLRCCDLARVLKRHDRGVTSPG